jgi:antitoxin ChpS
MAEPGDAGHLDVSPTAQDINSTAEGERLVVEPRERPRFKLEQLLAQCHPRATRSEQEREWLRNQPAGRELF